MSLDPLLLPTNYGVRPGSINFDLKPKSDMNKSVREGDAPPLKLRSTCVEETATHIGIREAEDWFRPIDLAKECDIYISSRSDHIKKFLLLKGYTQDPFKNRSQNFKPKIKENNPQYLERENKNCYICSDSSHCARDYSPMVSIERKKGIRTAGQRTVRMAVMACSQKAAAAFAHRRS
ncbi:hypothetical protein TNCV_3646861 [Trichonephila clavipes]|nr:hypothetical protein TNCV_3646861 [Trichonephila clavipes]